MIDLAGLTNALTDIIINIKDEDLKNLKIKKGSSTGLSHINQSILSKILKKTKPKYVQAGSPANTIFNSNALGLKTSLIGCVGYDNFGKNYIDNLKIAGINPIFKKTSGKSGTCYILVTPDGERTNVASIEVSGDFPAIEELEGLNPKILHTSGYEIASNPDKCEEIIDYLKNKKIKISFDPASRSTIKQKRKSIEKIVGKSDILFVTEEEAKEIIDLPPFKALKELSKICKVVALKRGSKGSAIKEHGQQYKIPIYPSKLVNTCGAGDSYASGFLFAYIQKLPLEECGRFASYIASRVCSKEESHL